MDRRIVRALMEAQSLESIGSFAETEDEEYGLYAYGLGLANLVVFQIGEDDGEIYSLEFHDSNDIGEWLKAQFGGCFISLDEEGQEDFDAAAFGQMVDAITEHFTGDIYS